MGKGPWRKSPRARGPIRPTETGRVAVLSLQTHFQIGPPNETRRAAPLAAHGIGLGSSNSLGCAEHIAQMLSSSRPRNSLISRFVHVLSKGR
jgi:hypothetical protein